MKRFYLVTGNVLPLTIREVRFEFLEDWEKINTTAIEEYENSDQIAAERFDIAFSLPLDILRKAYWDYERSKD